MYRETEFLSDGITIRGRLYLPEEGKGKIFPAVCACHGLPSGFPADPRDRGYPELAERIARWGYAVLIFNFRGAGLSGGNLDMGGWLRDLSAAIEYLYKCPEVDRSFVVLLGFSAGAAVSLCAASRDERVGAVIACASPAEFGFEDSEAALERFRSIGVIRDDDFPQSVETWAAGFKEVGAENCIGGIAPRPVVLIHGEEDEIVPISNARRLYDAAGEPKQLFILPGTGHRHLRRNDKVLEIVSDSLKTLRYP